MHSVQSAVGCFYVVYDSPDRFFFFLRFDQIKINGALQVSGDGPLEKGSE